MWQMIQKIVKPDIAKNQGRIIGERLVSVYVPFLSRCPDSGFGVAFRAKCKMFSRHLQKPILKTEKGRFKGL